MIAGTVLNSSFFFFLWFDSIGSSCGGILVSTPFLRPYPPPGACIQKKAFATLPYPGHPKGSYHPLPSPLVRIINLCCVHLSCKDVDGPLEDKRPNAIVTRAVQAEGTLWCVVKFEEHGWILTATGGGFILRVGNGVITGPLATTTITRAVMA